MKTFNFPWKKRRENSELGQIQSVIDSNYMYHFLSARSLIYRRFMANLDIYAMNNKLYQTASFFSKINGEYKFDVEISKLKSLDKWLDYSEILFEVNVTEALTGLRQNASGTVRFYPHENKVEFLESLPKTFKPGLKYTVLVRRIL